MAKADRIVSFILSGPLLSLDTRSEHHDRGGTIRGRGEPSMAAIFGLGGPYILLRTVRGNRFWGGTIHGVTSQPTTQQFWVDDSESEVQQKSTHWWSTSRGGQKWCVGPFQVFSVLKHQLIIHNRCVYTSPCTKVFYAVDAYTVTAAVELYHSWRLLAKALISCLWSG